jgi:hypothetical protein
MLHRSIGVALTVATAAMLLSSESAGARSGGAGGGHAGAFGSSRPSVPSGTHRFFPTPGAGIHFRSGHVAGDRRHAGHRRFSRTPFWLPLPDGGLLYGSYGDMFGGGAGAEATIPSVEPSILQAAIYRPACRLQTQIRAVPSENGGRREITITRCIHPGVSSLAGPGGEGSGPYAADANRPDDEAFDITSATAVAAGLRGPNVVRVGGCRSETRSVPAEGGGSRDVTITRC